MIKFNDTYSMSRDKYGWTLHQKIEGQKNPYKTYHPNLKQICDWIIDREAGKCESLDELKAMLKEASEGILKLMS